jgi:hypothetical protein
VNDGTLNVGTLCFLVGLLERAELTGRVVQVVAGPMSADDADGADWYVLSATWIREQFHGCEITARRGNLRAITPPPLTTPAPPLAVPIES